MPSDALKREALIRLTKLLTELASNVDLILVEGPRDVAALRTMMYSGDVATCSRFRVNDAELAEMIAADYRSVLVLTDFDQEGSELNAKLSELLEHMGVVVERGFRADVGRIMAVLGVREVEALDNVSESINNVF